jgi:hypothetical protein
MSFLDNLESNLKSLESQEEAQEQRERERLRRSGAREQALAEAPWAEKLKKSAFTADLLRQATRIGHAQRILVRPTWIGTTLRLDAGERRLELRPTPEGIAAVFQTGAQEPVDLEGKAEDLVRRWLG